MNSRLIKPSILLLSALLLQSIAYAEQDLSVESNSSEHSIARSSVLYDLAKPVPAKPYWYVQTSVYTKHFKPKSSHNNNQELIGLERHTKNSYLIGGATFLHSYNKRTYYGYVGKRYDFAGTPFYGKITGGLLYGYKGKYRDKIPLNRFEIAPAIVPSLGVKYRRLGAEIVLLGTAATMINIGLEL